MVEEFAETTQNTYKTQFLASSYGTFRSLVVMINLGPKTELLFSSLMQQALFECETPGLELKSLRRFLAIKRFQGTKSKSY